MKVRIEDFYMKSTLTIVSRKGATITNKSEQE
jgi:hypothetical protein